MSAERWILTALVVTYVVLLCLVAYEVVRMGGDERIEHLRARVRDIKARRGGDAA